MDLIQFGNTRLKVTRIGLGLAALGRPGYINLGHEEDLDRQYDLASMEAHTHQMLDLAYKKGIRYFDAARSYGQAELFLSTWAQQKNNLIVGSKWGYTYTANWEVRAEIHEVKEHSLQVLNRQWPESRHLLSDHLAIYHIHSASIESGVLQNNEVLDRLWELKNKGIIIGLSLSGATQADTLDMALRIKNNHQHLFQSVQVTWNLLERSTTETLENAQKAGFGIIVKEALANGRLTVRNKSTNFLGKFEAMERVAKKHGVGIDAIAMAYVLQQPWATVVLCGAANESHLLSNLSALSIKLDKYDNDILDQLTEPANAYWHTRSQLDWN